MLICEDRSKKEFQESLVKVDLGRVRDGCGLDATIASSGTSRPVRLFSSNWPDSVTVYRIDWWEIIAGLRACEGLDIITTIYALSSLFRHDTKRARAIDCFTRLGFERILCLHCLL